jgi:hypothetical protein
MEGGGSGAAAAATGEAEGEARRASPLSLLLRLRRPSFLRPLAAASAELRSPCSSAFQEEEEEAGEG